MSIEVEPARTRPSRRTSTIASLRRRREAVALGIVFLLAGAAPVRASDGAGVPDANRLVAAAAAVSPSAPTTLRLADLDGRWRQLEDEAATRDRMRAIDAAVEPLAWVVRKMAGGVLRSSTAPRPTLDFVWDGRRLHERVPGRSRVEARLIEPGSPPFEAIDPRGERFEGVWDWTSEGLRLRWSQPQAHGTNLYRLSPDKRTLTVAHSIQVTALDGLRPIAYQSRFVKDALPAVASDGEQR